MLNLINIVLNPAGKKAVSLSLIGGICGISAARLLMQGKSQEMAIMLVSFILLILSYAIGIGSLNLLKVIYMRKLKIHE